MNSFAQHEALLHTGELLLDEARRARIQVWIGKTGSLLWSPKRSNYFNEMLRENDYAVKLAIAYREAQE
jgi:hypothetical protein